MAISTINTKLSYKKGEILTNIPDLVSIPAMGASPEKIETTTLADSVKKYIPGLKDFGDLEFTFNYSKEVFQELKQMEDAYKADPTIAPTEFVVTLPDNSTFTFSAYATVIMGEGAVNAAYQFNLSLSLQTDIVYAVKE